MIGFGRIKRGRIAQRGDDGLTQRALGRIQRRAGRAPFLIGLHENRAGIAWPPVTELTARIGGVDRAQEQMHQPVIRQDRGIIGDLHHLQMAGAAAHDIAVAGVGHGPARKARHHIDHARDGFKIGLDAPETAARQNDAADIGGVGAMGRQGQHCAKRKGRDQGKTGDEVHGQGFRAEVRSISAGLWLARKPRLRDLTRS